MGIPSLNGGPNKKEAHDLAILEDRYSKNHHVGR